MMCNKSLFGSAVVLLSAVSTACAQAPATIESAQWPAGPEAKIAAALLQGEQASQGHGKEDAEALAAAARTLARMGAHPTDGQEDLVTAWSRQAIAMGASPGDAPAFRGRVLGPAYRRVQLSPAQKDVSSASFLAGQQASVTVTPVGKGQVNLHVQGANDSIACTVQRRRDGHRCEWLPLYTERYTITVSAGAGAPVTAFVVLN